MSISRTCKINDCNSIVKARGYCNKHWYRWYRGQDITAPSYRDKRPAIIEGDIAKIPLGKSPSYGYAIVDRNFAWLDRYIWHLNDNGYARSLVDGKIEYMHRLVTGRKYEIVDHIDRDRLNNRSSNLRNVDATGNRRNTTIISTSENPYIGVGWSKRDKKWYATITVNYKTFFGGAYESIEEAISARLHIESIYWS